MKTVLDTVWSRTLSPADRETLSQSDNLPPGAETVVVGAGLVGLSTAFYLVERGYSNVCVIDRGGPASEASGANAGGLWFAQQSPELGPVTALAKLSDRLYSELGERFKCDVARRGVLDLLYSEAQLADAPRRIQGMCASGFRAELASPEELRKLEPELKAGAGAIVLPEDGQVHPTKLAAALVRRIRDGGGRVCSGVEATGLSLPLETSRGRLRADRVVIAAGAWTPLVTEALGWTPPIRPVRGALLALPACPRRIQHTVMAGRYYYWQLEDGPIAGGGSEERVGFEPGVRSDTIEDIRAEMAEHFPGLKNQPTEVAWYGFRPYCDDLKPVIGAVPGRADLFVAAGHFRKGVMLAPATGYVLADILLGREPEADISAVDPARFPKVPA